MISNCSPELERYSRIFLPRRSMTTFEKMVAPMLTTPRMMVARFESMEEPASLKMLTE